LFFNVFLCPRRCNKDAEWQALLGGLKTNQYDMILSAMSRQEAGENNVNLSNTYYLLNDVIVVKKQNDKITSKEDLKNKIVGVQLGSGSEQVVDKLEGLKKVARYNYNPEAFLDLKHERIEKDKDELTKQINMALTKLKSNGVYDKLVQKWLEVK
jgi:polar amino acid transport system substrate-binding protein